MLFLAIMVREFALLALAQKTMWYWKLHRPFRLGSNPLGNSAGVVIRDSARYNFIGASTTGNLISGNRGDLFPLGGGVVIFGEQTAYNTVQRNLIGCDYTGTRAIRNRSAGVIIGGGASHNLIGGDSAIGNHISGNGTLPVTDGLAAGVHIFGHGTDSNTIAGNLIGVAADKSTLLPNNGHGIGIFGGAVTLCWRRIARQAQYHCPKQTHGSMSTVSFGRRG